MINTKRPRQPAQAIQHFSVGAVNVSLESKLANLLLDNVGVIISIPIAIAKSDYHPFRDGQSNAKMNLGQTWNKTDFLVVGIQKISNGKPIRIYTFHSSLQVSSYDEKNIGDGFYQVTPKGWNDSFYFNFNPSISKIESFIKNVPTDQRTFSGNRIAPNLENIGSTGAFETLKKKIFGEGFNSDPFFNDNVHGLFPNEKGEKTAVGGGLYVGNCR